MALLLTTVTAAAVWIVLLSLGIKPFDALMVAALMVFLAATVQLLARYLPGRRRPEPLDEGYTPR
jgi:hypothetical protein